MLRRYVNYFADFYILFGAKNRAEIEVDRFRDAIFPLRSECPKSAKTLFGLPTLSLVCEPVMLIQGYVAVSVDSSKPMEPTIEDIKVEAACEAKLYWLCNRQGKRLIISVLCLLQKS